MADETKRAAVYVSWVTMKNALEQLSQGIPSRIDRSVFQGIAWNVQNQLFAGMKFLGLLQGESEPTPLLDDLVKGSEEERKAKLKAILQDKYSDLIALDLTKITPAHLEESIGTLYGVSGDTREKAVRFFLNAANYAGIPLSSRFAPKKPGAPSGTKRRSSAPKKARSDVGKANGQTTQNQDGIPSSGTSKKVDLKSGGTLTLSATLDLFALNTFDRKFVFDLIDKLDEYEKSSSKDGNAQP